MILLDHDTVIQIFNPPPPPALKTWLEDHHFSTLSVDPEDDYTGSYTLSCAIHWASSRHPGAELIDVCSFAGLVQQFTSGFSGGFGTDEYQKERIIDNIVTTIVGGTPAPPGEIVGFIPADLATGERKPTPEETERIISIMDHAYFGDLADAVTAILETVSPEQAARIVLSMAQTNAEYKELLGVAKKFLARKSSIGELRQTVKRISDKMKFIRTSMLIELPLWAMEKLRERARREKTNIYTLTEQIITDSVKNYLF